MAKLRFKLSQRHSKSKDKKQLHGKMAGSRSGAAASTFSPSSQQQQEQGTAAFPPIPYIRCGFLQGKPPKILPTSTDEHHHTESRLPQSPVNRKAVDITFPARAGAGVSVPVTPLPKKWLTLGCDPCKQQASLLHEDYKLPPSSITAAAIVHNPESSRERRRKRKHKRALGTSSSVTPLTSSPVDDGARQPESSSSPPAQAHNREDWQPEMRWKVVARSENKVVQRQVVLQKKASASSSKPQQQESKLMTDDDAAAESLLSAPANFKCGPEGAMYKLMTTSPDQSMENDSPYAWDKDLSPFASESSIFTSPNSVNRIAGSRMCASPQKAFLSSRYMSSHSSNSSSSHGSAVFKLTSPSKEAMYSRFHWSASPPLAPGQFDDYQAFYRDPEALSKSWERSKEKSGFRISADEVGDEDEEGTQAHHHTGRGSPERQKIEYLCIEEHESKHVKHRVNRKQQQSQEFTSRVMESFAVQKTSVNPYRDFRESMIEMILKKDLFQYQDLEELLRTYLILNSEEFHDVIIRVFTDLWHQLYSYDSS